MSCLAADSTFHSSMPFFSVVTNSITTLVRNRRQLPLLLLQLGFQLLYGHISLSSLSRVQVRHWLRRRQRIARQFHAQAVHRCHRVRTAQTFGVAPNAWEHLFNFLQENSPLSSWTKRILRTHFGGLILQLLPFFTNPPKLLRERDVAHFGSNLDVQYLRFKYHQLLIPRSGGLQHAFDGSSAISVVNVVKRHGVEFRHRVKHLTIHRLGQFLILPPIEPHCAFVLSETKHHLQINLVIIF